MKQTTGDSQILKCIVLLSDSVHVEIENCGVGGPVKGRHLGKLNFFGKPGAAKELKEKMIFR